MGALIRKSGVCRRRPDDHVAVSVAIAVATTAHGGAELVAGDVGSELVEGRGRDTRWPATIHARKTFVGRAGIVLAQGKADHHIGVTIAIHIARFGNAASHAGPGDVALEGGTDGRDRAGRASVENEGSSLIDLAAFP